MAETLLRSELEALETETFEVVDCVDLEMNLAGSTSTSCSSGSTSCACSCTSTTSTTSTVTCSCV